MEFGGVDEAEEEKDNSQRAEVWDEDCQSRQLSCFYDCR